MGDPVPTAGLHDRLIAQFDSERNPSMVDLRETQVYGGRGTFQRLSSMTMAPPMSGRISSGKVSSSWSQAHLKLLQGTSGRSS